MGFSLVIGIRCLLRGWQEGLTRHLSLNGGLTKIANAFFTGGYHRVYVDSNPHFVANAALTLVPWHGWSGSLRMRAITIAGTATILPSRLRTHGL